MIRRSCRAWKIVPTALGRRRRPTWTAEQVQQVLRLRTQYPIWGKDKLAVLLGREGCRISTSKVGPHLDSPEKPEAAWSSHFAMG